MARGWEEYLAELRAKRAEARGMGGREAVGKTHARGKLTARERIERLLDPGSFREIGLLAQGRVEIPGRAPTVVHAEGVVTGWGDIAGRKVFVSADDGTLLGGASSSVTVEKRFRLRRMAMEQGYPFIGLYEGSAIRFQDSMQSRLFSHCPAFQEAFECSGVIPQVTGLMGACFGRAPEWVTAELVLIVKGTGFLGWSGPTLVRGGLGEEVDLEELAGAEVHSKTTGLVDVVAADEAQCLNSIKEFLSYMPSSCWELPPSVATADSPDRQCPELLDIVSPDLKKPYDMHRVIATLVDEGKYYPFKKDFGKTVVACLARLNGHSVGIVANQPSYLGGAMDVDGCYKARRFISMCDAFHIPLVFLQDQPGFMVGKEAERQRAVYWGVSLLEAQHRTTVPKLTVILRKSHGAALWAMGGRVSKDNPDLMAAWPLAIMSGTGPQAAVYTIHDKELRTAPDPEGLRRSLEEHYRQWSSVYGAAEAFGIDDIIEPQETRRFLIAGLEMTRAKLKRQLGKRHPVDY